MEYYIMKKYLNAKKENKDVEQGFNRFDKNTKIKIGIGLGAMLVSLLALVLVTLLSTSFLWQIVFVIIFLISLLMVMHIEKRDEKEHLEKYSESYEKKLEILYELLVNNYKVKTADKLDELIAIYQKVIDSKEKEEKKRNKIIFTMFSVFAGIASISFTNMETIGVNFNDWMVLIIVLLFIVGSIAIGILSESLFDSLKKQYIAMVEDLEELKFKRY